jgi:hypothetical protein
VGRPVDDAVTALAGIDLEALDGAPAAEVLVERVDTARPWTDDGYRTVAAWLAASDHTSLDDARADVRLARRLRTMPATAAALAAGDITLAHARRLARLNAPDTAEAFAEAEQFLVGQARSLRWADFTKAADYWLRHACADRDPDPARSDRDQPDRPGDHARAGP